MKMIFILIIFSTIVVTTLFFFYKSSITIDQHRSNHPTKTVNSSSKTQPPSDANRNSLTEPVEKFKQRVTKKPFGLYVSPTNSPISPEKFTGFHTGADSEYQDITGNVPVYAIADCVVVLSKTASGYGGVFVVKFIFDNHPYTAIYGHIRPTSLPKVGQTFTRGEEIALLGTGYSKETDGERRHLHLGIMPGSSPNIKGYVQHKTDLKNWLDPMTFFN
jgi:murein DD-endopeptidase MepM/ murein hydrolase activator NlpD